MEEPSILICTKTSSGPAHVPTATQANCSRCDAPVWVSPSSHEQILHYNCEIVCIECAIPDIKADPTMAPLTKAQIEEIKKYG